MSERVLNILDYLSIRLLEIYPDTFVTARTQCPPDLLLAGKLGRYSVPLRRPCCMSSL